MGVVYLSRFKHVSVRTNSESLSFHGCVRVESGKVNSLLLSLCQTQQSIVNRKLILDLATNWFNYFGAILTFMVIAVPIFTGTHFDGKNFQ